MSDNLFREGTEERKKQKWFEELHRIASRNVPQMLLRAFEASRQTGTTTMLAWLAQRERVSVIVANERQLESFERCMKPGGHPGTIITTIAQSPMRLRGLH